MFLTIALIAGFVYMVISINDAGGSSELDYSDDDIILAKWLKKYDEDCDRGNGGPKYDVASRPEKQ